METAAAGKSPLSNPANPSFSLKFRLVTNKSQNQSTLLCQIHNAKINFRLLVRLVVPNTEELISRPFMALLKIRWLLQDRMRTWDPHFWVALLNRSLLFCPLHMHTLLPLLSGHRSRICSETGLMYLSPNKYTRPASEQILLECPLMSGSCVCVRGKTKVTG